MNNKPNQPRAMSLAVGDEGRGGRSRSRSRDRRSRDEPPRDAPTYADIREPSYVYPEDDLDDRYRSSRRGRDDAPSGGGLPYPAEGGIDHMLPGSKSLYDYDSRQPTYRTVSPGPEKSYRSSRDKVDSQPPGSFPDDDDDGDRPRIRTAEPRDAKYGSSGSKRDSRRDSKRDSYRTRPDDSDDDDDDRRVRYAEPPRGKYDVKPDLDDEKLKFLPQKYSRKYADDDSPKASRGSDREKEKDRKKDRRSRQDEEDLAYGRAPPRSPRADSPPTYGSYVSGSQWDDKRSSRRGPQDDEPERRRPVSPSADEPRRSHRDSYRDDPRASGASVLTVEGPSRERDRSRDRRRDKSPGPASLMAEPERRTRDRSSDRRSSNRDKSPQPPTARMSNLSVDTGRSSTMALSLAAAPGSPLLESYHGTYQDMSPMPSPLLIASQSGGDDPRILEALSPIGSDAEDGKRRSRRARFHDPEDIASRLARALKGDRPPDTEPLIEILPSLTHEQVMELRTEYKRLVKTGSERKGVNVAKHIRARLKDEDPNLMKACYSVALGKWESESYWANFWYQGDKTRRELLIESLMGRTNEEIRRIKDAFTDKKYDNSLTRCMKMELKEDKFKKAVLMVLDERRMEEFDHHGRRLPPDYELVDKDVEDLRHAVKGDKGGESLMISIIVLRSDTHLRSVLKEYERHYRSNFARDSLKKSGNLVVSFSLSPTF